LSESRDFAQKDEKYSSSVVEADGSPYASYECKKQLVLLCHFPGYPKAWISAANAHPGSATDGWGLLWIQF